MFQSGKNNLCTCTSYESFKNVLRMYYKILQYIYCLLSLHFNSYYLTTDREFFTYEWITLDDLTTRFFVGGKINFSKQLLLINPHKSSQAVPGCTLEKYKETLDLLFLISYNCQLESYKMFRANVAQLTVAGSIVKLKELRNKYDSSVSAIIDMCNIQVNEYTFHVLFQCPKYNDLRCKFLNKSSLPDKNEYLCFWFEKFCKEDPNCLYCYTEPVKRWKHAIIWFSNICIMKGCIGCWQLQSRNKLTTL